jgi:hypothetical protein
MTKARDLANASTALSAVDATELAFVDGVTSAIQTQMDAKLATATATSTYIPKTLTTTTGDTIYASGANTPARLGIGSTGNVLTVSGGVPVWSAPAGGGKVLQVVSATTTTSTVISSTTLTDTTITATITPTLSTSKILVIASVNSRVLRNSVKASGGLILLRGATTIADYNNGGYSWLFPDCRTTGTGTQISLAVSGAVTYLDSPATTSATTYKMQGRVEIVETDATITFQYSGTPSTITLLEIGA